MWISASDSASDGAVAPRAYVVGRTIYLTSAAPGGAEFGEAEAFTAVGQPCVIWNPALHLDMGRMLKIHELQSFLIQ